MKSYWPEIAEMGWGYRSLDAKALSREFTIRWGKDKMQAIFAFANKRVEELSLRVDEWEESNPALKIDRNNTDFNDAAYHVVGLGQQYFSDAMQNPRIIETTHIIHNYTASFAECFDYTPESNTIHNSSSTPNNPHAIKLDMEREIRKTLKTEDQDCLIERLMEFYSAMPITVMLGSWKMEIPPIKK